MTQRSLQVMHSSDPESLVSHQLSEQQQQQQQHDPSFDSAKPTPRKRGRKSKAELEASALLAQQQAASNLTNQQQHHENNPIPETPFRKAARGSRKRQLETDPLDTNDAKAQGSSPSTAAKHGTTTLTHWLKGASSKGEPAIPSSSLKNTLKSSLLQYATSPRLGSPRGLHEPSQTDLTRSRTPSSAAASEEGDPSSTASTPRRSQRSTKRPRFNYAELADAGKDGHEDTVPTSRSRKTANGNDSGEEDDQYEQDEMDKDDADNNVAGEDEDDNDYDGDGDAKEVNPITTTTGRGQSSRKPKPKSRPTPSRRETETLSFVKDEFDSQEVGNHNLITFTGPSCEYKKLRLSLRSSDKRQSIQTSAIYSVYDTPDLAVMEAGVQPEFNQDEPEQGDSGDPRPGICWPDDGLARTRLIDSVSGNLKKQRAKFWNQVPGFIPPHHIRDSVWWPGKGFGYKESLARSAWAVAARDEANAASSSETVQDPPSLVGWPFLHPSLDVTSVKVLSASEARVYNPVIESPHPQINFKHPTTVSSAALGRAVFPQTPKKKGKGSNASKGDGDAGGGGSDAGLSEDEEDDEEPSSTQDQHEIDLSDDRFSGIQNLGFEEKAPIGGQQLEFWMGPYDQQQKVVIDKGTSIRLDSKLEGNEGHVLNAGGWVYDLDWAPIPIHLNSGKEFLAVSASAQLRPTTKLGAKEKRPVPGCIQIWSVAPDTQEGEMRLELNICIDSGTAFKLAWCPVGHDFLPNVPASQDQDDQGAEGTGPSKKIRRLGLLAGAFADGSASIFCIPHPDDVGHLSTTDGRGGKSLFEPVHIKLEPILRLELKTAGVNCLDWAGGELLAAGFDNGYIAVWNVGSLLRSGCFSSSCSSSSSSPIQTVSPTHLFRCQRAAVTGITFHHLPPIDVDGIPSTTSLPRYLYSVSLDGSLALSDLQDPTSVVHVDRHRSTCYTCCFLHQGGSIITESAECTVTVISTRPEEFGRARTLAASNSRILSLASSPFHPVIALTTASGYLIISNSLRTGRKCVKVQTPIFRLDHNRSTGQLRMIDHFLVQEVSNFHHRTSKSSYWSSEISITTSKWNPNLGRCLLLASAAGCGLVRIDWVMN